MIKYQIGIFLGYILNFPYSTLRIKIIFFSFVTALGIEACDQEVRTRFVTGCGLVNELTEVRDEKRLGILIKRYFNYGLLLLMN